MTIPKALRNMAGAVLLRTAEAVIHPEHRVDLVEEFRKAMRLRIYDRFGK